MTENAARGTTASRDRLLSILNTVVDGIVIINARGLIETFNPAAERIFGYTAEEVRGRNVNMLMPTPYRDEHDGYIENYQRSGQAKIIGIGREVSGLRKDGSTFPLDLAVSEFTFEGDRYFTGIIRDITDRKRSEEQLRRSKGELERTLSELQAATQQLWQSAKLASVGELAASIAHELNNPLATITLRLESLLANTSLDAAARQSLSIVQQESDRMASLVANLLQFTRSSPEQESSVDLLEELERSLELLRHLFRKHEVQVDVDIDSSLPIVYADRQKLRQVFLNLLSNASDAMPRGGRLRLRAGRATLSDRPAVEISFSDTGGGIPPEHLGKVMDPFFTTKEEGKGTGLGLAICRRIVVQEHSGNLLIDSVVGQGTTVRVVLPTKRSTKSAGGRRPE